MVSAAFPRLEVAGRGARAHHGLRRGRHGGPHMSSFIFKPRRLCWRGQRSGAGLGGHRSAQAACAAGWPGVRGMHSCHGCEIALIELARCLQEPRLVEDPPPYREGASLRGPRHLMVSLHNR